MARRIDVELTSARDDGTWTWRAAGARQPKGVLDAALLPPGARVGDVLRAEVDSDVDGMIVLAVIPPKGAKAAPERLEVIGPRRRDDLVTTALVSRGRRERRDGRPGRDGRDGREGREGREGRGGPGRESREGRPRGEGGRGPRGPRPEPEARSRAKRLRPGHAHRDELMASLAPEEQPIAEQLARGGLAAVRQAIDKQNAEARAGGQPEIPVEPLVALAERLWSRVREADWRDRADAAAAEVDELDLRDLRSVVVAAETGARGEEARELAARLREALTRRVDEEHNQWLEELSQLVQEGRTVAALRRSSRPPKAGAPLPADLARQLGENAAEALGPDVGQDRWAVVLDALAFSPVRMSVKPETPPANPSDDLVAAVRKLADRIPHIAALFGVEPEPARTGARRRPRSGGRGDGGPAIPPPPPLPTAEAAAPTAPEPDEAVEPGEGEAVEAVEAVAEPVAPADSEADAAETAPGDLPEDAGQG
ncbi:MAG: hypothetical protein ACKVWR_02360 [Acidimicrobiales bacterium]